MTTLPRGNELTREDLDAMPADGRRYELIDGVIVVSAAPVPRHQRVVLRLAMLLHPACPRDLEVFVAPLDVVLAPNAVLEPDVLVARRANVTSKDLAGPPVLAVEVLSPSTRGQDLMIKHERYERAGCPSYWVIDPGGDTNPPSLIAWELKTGKYVEVARVAGDESWSATLPFPVTVVPNDLLDD